MSRQSAGKTVTRSVHGLLIALVLVFGVGSATVDAGPFTYDAAPVSRADVSSVGTTESSQALTRDEREASAPAPVPGSSTSTTSLARNNATESGTIYRTGSRTDGALTDPTGVSFRDSISSSADKAQVFKPNDKIWAVDTAKLPPGSVIRDGVPAGHVSVNATPDAIRAGVFDDPLLSGSGMKLLEDGSYRLPK